MLFTAEAPSPICLPPGSEDGDKNDATGFSQYQSSSDLAGSGEVQIPIVERVGIQEIPQMALSPVDEHTQDNIGTSGRDYESDGLSRLASVAMPQIGVGNLTARESMVDVRGLLSSDDRNKSSPEPKTPTHNALPSVRIEEPVAVEPKINSHSVESLESHRNGKW